MKSESYDFTASQVTNPTGNGCIIYAFMPLTISLDTLALVDTRTQAQVEQGIIATATITLSNGASTVSKTIEVEGTKKRYAIGLSLAVPEFGTWQITWSAAYCQLFYESGVFVVIGGISGSLSNRQGYPLDCQITVNYDQAWTIDGQNDEYPYPVGTDPTEFTEFEKDADGYPINWGVWKLDDQNDGYPWIVGYLPASGGGQFFEKLQGQLIARPLFIKSNGTLIPVQFTVKGGV